MPTTAAGIKGAVTSKLKGMMGGIKIPGLSGGQRGGADAESDARLQELRDTAAEYEANKKARLERVLARGEALGISVEGEDTMTKPQSISLMTKLFGYKLVDPATPTAEETSSRTYLRVMAGVESALIVTCALYYGIDTLILKNKL